MTKEEVRTLKVGDLLTWKNPETYVETIEVVIKNGCVSEHIHVQLRTVAVLYDPNDELDVGDDGWINDHNCDCLERIA